MCSARGSTSICNRRGDSEEGGPRGPARGRRTSAWQGVGWPASTLRVTTSLTKPVLAKGLRGAAIRWSSHARAERSEYRRPPPGRVAVLATRAALVLARSASRRSSTQLNSTQLRELPCSSAVFCGEPRHDVRDAERGGDGRDGEESVDRESRFRHAQGEDSGVHLGPSSRTTSPPLPPPHRNSRASWTTRPASSHENCTASSSTSSPVAHHPGMRTGHRCAR